MFRLGAGDEKAGILQSRTLGFSVASAKCLSVVLWTGCRVRGDISAPCKPMPACREWICVRRGPWGMAWVRADANKVCPGGVNDVMVTDTQDGRTDPQIAQQAGTMKFNGINGRLCYQVKSITLTRMAWSWQCVCLCEKGSGAVTDSKSLASPQRDVTVKSFLPGDNT